MSTEKLLEFLTGMVVGIIVLLLALNGKRWYNQLFRKEKKS